LLRTQVAAHWLQPRRTAGTLDPCVARFLWTARPPAHKAGCTQAGGDEVMQFMKWLAVAAGLMAACGCQSGTPLFNGRDLTGWQEVAPQGAWSVRDGVLTCSGQKDPKAYTWLCTDRKYGDFELTCDWRVQDGTNSGVFLRVPERQGHASMTGLEVQVRDDAADKNCTDVSGAVFQRIPASGRYARPVGQWNRFKLTMTGRKLRIELNGHLVSETNIDTIKPQGKDPPMSAIPNRGYIGLQNHGTPVEFRDIRIRDLSAATVFLYSN
jgi:hypothetical protein